MKGFSGKFVLRIPNELHSVLYKRSQELGVSLNSLCCKILSSSTSFSTAPIDSISHSSLISSSFLQSIIEFWREKLCAILLFGSVAKAAHTPSSDVDLLLVLKNHVEPTRELYREWDVFYEKSRKEFSHTQEISPQFVQCPHNVFDAGGLWYEVAIQGVLLWQSDESVFHFLQNVREIIACGKIIRHFSHGHPYWVKLR